MDIFSIVEANHVNSICRLGYNQLRLVWGIRKHYLMMLLLLHRCTPSHPLSSRSLQHHFCLPLTLPNYTTTIGSQLSCLPASQSPSFMHISDYIRHNLHRLSIADHICYKILMIVHCYSILFTYLYMAPLAVKTNQRQFHKRGPAEAKAHC